jgi:2-polyprenyl-6-hydroxyphenyl methylase/3-demethylubiquinone-9 3-methyltransferase
VTGYYAERLSAERLRRCYEIASPRVRQYLDAEVSHVAGRIRPSDRVLELGCGYGRVVKELVGKAGTLIGIDTSLSSLQLARELMCEQGNTWFLAMDACALGFRDGTFDVVLCIQNGLSAFKVDQRVLIGECIRVARPGGRVLFSSYAQKFWKDRLAWFQLQSDEGLLGEIDHDATGDGVIVCKDGFRATTISPDDFMALMSEFNVHPKIEEVDESSLFCEIVV